MSHEVGDRASSGRGDIAQSLEGAADRSGEGAAPTWSGEGGVADWSGEGPELTRIAVFGGVYSNHLALEAAIADAGSRDVDAILCLGDLGAFGPNPDKVFPLLRDHRIPVVRGNYDDSIARGLDDCQCGYTDPRDNHYARLSYRYTYRKTSPENRAWMGAFPRELRFRLGGRRVLAFHGSPRQTNEFLWESTTPTHFLDKLARDHATDVLLGTHTGIHWSRSWKPGEVHGPSGAGKQRQDEAAEAGARTYVNVGALGRPANDGRTEVWYALLDGSGEDVQVDFVPVGYDHRALAEEMRSEELPEEFVETILTGWWTTCLEILPGKERAAGRF
ncbi:MAG: metallophosphoesterase family protein [Longimicrobiales bacterium]|nr:metallophosphoesterase family protein [Longimicrobiales bacterium]